MRTTFLFLLMMLTFPLAGTAEDALAWRPYFFDGREWRAGNAAAGPTLYRKEGFLPVIKTPAEPFPEDRLPAGTGGIVIFCYLESAGGKLQRHAGFAPLPGIVIEIGGTRKPLALRSDAGGYAILALPPGEYELRVRGIRNKVHIERDKTSFVPIRAGKRMID